MFAAILLPCFSLQAALRLREELWDTAVAVVDGDSEKGAILEATLLATTAGVQTGMTAAQALARCPSLRLLPRSPTQEGTAGNVLLEAACALSPWVERTRDGTCIADLRRAPAGDWHARGSTVVARLAALRLRARVGIAGNPDLALLAACSADPVHVVEEATAFLEELEIEQLSPLPETLAVLRDWGIRRLGELARLPKSDLVQRLGPEAECLWDRAAGRSQRLLELARTPEAFEEAFDFEHGIETVEPLLFLLRRFLDQLALRLRAAWRVAGKMRLTLALENGGAYERLFAIPAPTGDVETLFRILHTHLESLQLDQRPVALRLGIEPADGGNEQMRLFENPMRDPNRFGETLGRLSALVGEGNVGVPRPADTHRPDGFTVVTPDFTAGREPWSDQPSMAIGLPLRRYRPPHAAQVQVVHHNPVFVAFALARGGIRDALGPYRVSGEWWDARTWSLEEWDIELVSGELYRIARRGDTWSVEGCYECAALR